jgi:hypothetical protein
MSQRECYTITGGCAVRIWAAFLEWPRPGESVAEFVARLQQEYTAQGQDLFDIELSRHGDGAPKSALVKLKVLETGS